MLWPDGNNYWEMMGKTGEWLKVGYGDFSLERCCKKYVYRP